MKCVLAVALFGVLLGLTVARPDLSLGYRYNQGHASGGSSFLTAPVSQGPSAVVTSFAPTASGSTYFNSFPTVGQVDTAYGGSTNNGFNTFNSGSVASGSSNQFSSSFQQQQQVVQSSSSHDEQEAFLSHLHNHQAPVVSKNFYLYSAPVEHDHHEIVRHINVGRPQKNYRVVFIDAPSSTATKAKIIANVAPTEDKTAIYVLSRKTNALDISADVVTQAPVTNKPDVFFIKYKTPEEAVHAQHVIQAQYDQLGGSTDVSNEGVVPVSSVIGSLNSEAGAGHVLAGSSSSLASTLVSAGESTNNEEQAGSVNFGTLTTNTGSDNTHQVYLPAAHK